MSDEKVSDNFSAGGGFFIRNIVELPAAIKEKLNNLWITDAEELVALWSIEDSRKVLSEYLEITETELQDYVTIAEKNVHPSKLEYLRSPAPADVKFGALEPSEEEAVRALQMPMLSQEEAANLPPSVDFSNIMPPNRDQGDRETCCAFANTALHEFYSIRMSVPLDFSEESLHYQTKKIDGWPDDCKTWLSKSALALAQTGQCRESDWPYNPKPPCNYKGDPPPNAGPFSLLSKMSLEQLQFKDINSIKAALASGRVVSFAIPVYNSWFNSPATRQSGKITMPVSGEISLGNHAMCLIGYKDDPASPGGGYFILRNTWKIFGTNCLYGPGNGTIPYSYISNYNGDAYASPSTKTIPLYSYWNAKSFDHFYTADLSALGNGAMGYVLEDIKFYAYPAFAYLTLGAGRLRPLHRYWNEQLGDHFYTINLDEAPEQYGYVHEGVECSVLGEQYPNTAPLYRYWNEQLKDHYYTTDWNQLGTGKSGYVFEHIECFVCTW